MAGEHTQPFYKYYVLVCILPSSHINETMLHTKFKCHHGSTAVPNAVGGHNTDSVYHIVGQGT